MKKIAFVLVCALAVMLLAACSTTYPFDAGATGMVGSKVGEASQSFIGSYYMGAVAGFPLKGEGGVQMAAKNGGISKIGTVDIRIDWPASPAIPFCTVTTVVSGDQVYSVFVF